MINYCSERDITETRSQGAARNKIESYVEYGIQFPRTAFIWIILSRGPIVHRTICPLEHSEGMFRWVYDLTNDSELSLAKWDEQNVEHSTPSGPVSVSKGRAKRTSS